MDYNTNNKTKMPNIDNDILHRPRIDKLLLNASENSVVTVTAGAGYGKTRAVSMFMNNINARTAWLQLSKTDNYEEVFWVRFLNGILFNNKNTYTYLMEIGFPNTSPKFEYFIRLFAREVYSGKQMIIALDDFHYLNNQSILDFIQKIIYINLENFCMIFISRTKVNLDISGIFDIVQTGHIGMEDLCFTLDETEDYLKLQGLLLPKNDLEKIHSFTGGWPLALYLINLSIKEDGIVSGDPITGAIPLIFDLIEREIFSLYTPQIQNLFIKFSLLDTFPIELIKKLSGDKFDDMLLEIISTNMFIQYDLNSKCYNIHQLFLDFLIKKQVYLKEHEIVQIYLLSADWFADQKQIVNALTYYKKCRRNDKIWDIIFHMQPERRPKEYTEFLIELLEELPKEFTQKKPLIRVMRASFLLNNMELKSAEEDLLNLIEEIKAQPQTGENINAEGEAYIVLGMVYLALRDYRFIHYFKKANECLPDGSIFNYSNIRIIDSNDPVLPLSPARRDIDEMLAAIFEAVPYISKVTHGLGDGVEFLAAAEDAYFTGNTREAETQVFHALYKAKQKKQIDVVCGSYYLLMRIALLKGDYKSITDYLKQLKEYVEHSSDKAIYSMLDIAESWFYIKAGAVQNTARWILDDTLNDRVYSPISVGRDKLIRAYYLLENERYNELLPLLDLLDEIYYQKGLFFEFIFSTVLRTITLYETKDQQWMRALQNAYEISRQSNYIMQFIEMGNYMRKIINTAKSLKNHDIPIDWLDNIYSRVSTYNKRLTYIKAEYSKEHKIDKTKGFTKREKEILQNLCQGLTREEIADNLYLSVSTVKHTLNSIYNKLGAINNTDAVRIATELNIV